MRYETRWDIVDEHLDAADSLVGLWEASLESARYDLDRVRTGPERRLLAHVDALTVGGEGVADDRLVPCIAEESGAPQVVAAALALLGGGLPHRVDWLLETLAATGEETKAAIVRALGLCDHPQLSACLLAAYRRAREASQRVPLLRALARRQVAVGAELESALRSTDAELVEAALEAAVNGAPRSALRLIESRLDAPEEATQRAALRAGLVLGSRYAWECCVHRAGAGSRDALTMVALVGDGPQHDWLARRVAAGSAAALWAAGFTGRVGCARACLDLLDDEELGPLAGEAFAAITGADPESDPLFEPGDDDDPTGLSRPDAAAVRSWWAANEPRFDARLQYLRGEAFDARTLVCALRSEPMRRREPLALELMIRTRGAAALATSAFTTTQLRQHTRLAGLPRLDRSRPYPRISWAA